jgi:hypothetical protein
MSITRKFVLGFAVLATSAVASPRIWAQNVIDRSNVAVTPAQGFSFINSDWTGVTFRPTGANVSGAGVFLENYYNKGPNSGTLFASLMEGGPNGTLLASGSSPFTTPSGSLVGSFFDVFFSAPVSVTAGNDYTVVFHGLAEGARVVTTYNSDKAQESDLFYSNDGVSYASYGAKGYSLNFREYTAVTATPEPASMVLMATGLFGIAAVVRRKRIS